MATVGAACIAAFSVQLTGCNRTDAADQQGALAADAKDGASTAGQFGVAANAVDTDMSTHMESVIDEELLMQKALSSRLDRDPFVRQEMERARRQILARAYEERNVVPHTQISAAAKLEYYRSHPTLFAHRRFYRTLTFSIARTDLTHALRESLDHARSAIEVRQLLDQRSIAFEAIETTRPAEEIPKLLLPQLAQATPGDVLIVSQPHESHAMLVWLVGVRERPIDFEHASAQIGRYLTDVRNREVLAQYLQHERSAADIAYIRSGNNAELQADALD